MDWTLFKQKANSDGGGGGGQDPCIALRIVSQQQIAEPEQKIDPQFVPASSVHVCRSMENTTAALPYVSLSVTTFVNGSNQYKYVLNTQFQAPEMTSFGSQFSLFSDHIDFDVSVNQLVIGYGWIDALTSSAGVFSLSISVWLFLFPSVPQVAHRRFFVIDRYATLGCADGNGQAASENDKMLLDERAASDGAGPYASAGTYNRNASKRVNESDSGVAIEAAH